MRVDTLAVLALATLVGCARAADEGRVVDTVAAADCDTGCAAPPPTSIPQSELDVHFAQVAVLSAGTESLALDTLLFHREAAAERLDHALLSKDHHVFLEREFSVVNALVSIRLVDEEGVVRAVVENARMPLGERRHLPILHRARLQPVELSGTVVRTGLHYLWSRF